MNPLRRTLPLLVACLAGCSPAASDEPPPRQVRREVARLLEETQHLRLTDFRQEGEGHYAAEAQGSDGASYHVDVTVQGRTLIFKAEGRDRYLGGRKELPEPPFDEKHPQAMQWLRGLACALQTAGAVWPVLGRFGLRRRYSPRVETALALFAAVNAAFAAWWVYQIVINWGVT
jgi:hypothetical protein